jgi:hypothetical protein
MPPRICGSVLPRESLVSYPKGFARLGVGRGVKGSTTHLNRQVEDAHNPVLVPRGRQRNVDSRVEVPSADVCRGKYCVWMQVLSVTQSPRVHALACAWPRTHLRQLEPAHFPRRFQKPFPRR